MGSPPHLASPTALAATPLHSGYSGRNPCFFALLSPFAGAQTRPLEEGLKTDGSPLDGTQNEREEKKSIKNLTRKSHLVFFS